MFFDTIKKESQFSKDKQNGAVCFIGYENDQDGRISLKLKDLDGQIFSIKNDSVVKPTSVVGNTIICNYQLGDIFYTDSETLDNISEAYNIVIANLNNPTLQGKVLLLKLTNVKQGVTFKFASQVVFTSQQAGNYFLKFANITGNSVECIDIFKSIS